MQRLVVLQRWLLLLYLAFVVYGSLVPFHFVYRPFGDALAVFGAIPLHVLGIESRSDLVANLLLFIPVTFLAGLVLRVQETSTRPVFAMAVIQACSIGLAVVIEFTQLYFPGRTVGLNDIYAESAGAFIGILCCRYLGTRFQTWVAGYARDEAYRGRVGRLLHG